MTVQFRPLVSAENGDLSSGRGRLSFVSYNERFIEIVGMVAIMDMDRGRYIEDIISHFLAN